MIIFGCMQRGNFSIVRVSSFPCNLVTAGITYDYIYLHAVATASNTIIFGFMLCGNRM